MKVTDEMVQAGVAKEHEARLVRLPIYQSREQRIRDIVEAALAAAPEVVSSRRLIERWEREAAKLNVLMNQASKRGEHETARWGDDEVRVLRLHAAELRDVLAVAAPATLPEEPSAMVQVIKREVLNFVQHEVEIDGFQLRALGDVIDGAAIAYAAERQKGEG